MKKVTLLVLILALVVGITATSLMATGCQAPGEEEMEEPDFKIVVFSDPQVAAEIQIKDVNSESWHEFDDIGQKMLVISEAILKSTIDRIIEEGDADCVLIPGDLTEDGALVAHEVIAKHLQKLEDAGIPVYVIDGNHDLNRGDPGIYTTEGRLDGGVCRDEDFVRIYNNFGYDEAIAMDNLTLSYVADLNDQYRLIVVDVYSENEGLTPSLLAWTETQLKQCVKDGKTPITMTHVPILEHLGDFIGNLGLGDSVIDHDKKFAEMLIKYGVEINLCGHMHATDALSYTTADGTIYDLETGCLCNNDMPIRYLEFYGDYTKTYVDGLKSIDSSYIPSYMTDEERTKIETDLVAYAWQYFDDDLMGICLDNVNAKGWGEMICTMLGLDMSNSQVKALADSVYDEVVMKFLHLPIWQKDAEDGGLSLEKICAEYGITLPPENEKPTDLKLLSMVAGTYQQKQKYIDLEDVAMGIAKQQFSGDEHATIDSFEGLALRYGVYSAFYIIDQFDLFGKLHAIDSNIPLIDMGIIADRLFKDQVLDLKSDNFIIKAFNLAMPIVGDMLPDSLAILKNLKVNSETGDPSAIFKLAKGLTANLKIFGITVGDYLDCDNGTILIGKLLDEVLWGKAAYGTIVDFSIPDNYYIIQK